MDRDYPYASVRKGEEGDVHVRYLVQENGRVGEVVVEQSSGSADLDASAVAVVKRWIFRPAMKDGKPIAMWQEAVVRFRLH